MAVKNYMNVSYVLLPGANEKEILEQLQLDLETLSYKVSRLIHWPLKDKQKAAVFKLCT